LPAGQHPACLLNLFLLWQCVARANCVQLRRYQGLVSVCFVMAVLPITAAALLSNGQLSVGLHLQQPSS
jgi:hypothetical protein